MLLEVISDVIKNEWIISLFWVEDFCDNVTSGVISLDAIVIYIMHIETFFRILSRKVYDCLYIIYK